MAFTPPPLVKMFDELHSNNLTNYILFAHALVAPTIQRHLYSLHIFKTKAPFIAIATNAGNNLVHPLINKWAN
jgi:hypothetical protein